MNKIMYKITYISLVNEHMNKTSYSGVMLLVTWKELN